MQLHKVRRSGAVLAALAACGSLVPSTWAETKNWLGGTSATWDTAAAWGPNAGEPGAADDVFFPAVVPNPPGATITLTAGELANSLTFNNTYTLNGGDLTLTSVAAGTTNVTVNGSSTATINSALLGVSNPLTKAGTGTLTLRGTNLFTGQITILGGALNVATDANLGNTANRIVIDGGTLVGQTAANLAINAGRVIEIGALGATLSSTGSNFGTPNTADRITGSGPITKIGSANFRVEGGNSTLSSNWTIQAGTVEVNSATSFGSGTVTLTGGNAAHGAAAAIANNFFLSGGGISPVNGDRTYGGMITLTSATNSFFYLNDFFQDTARSMTLAGQVTGSGNVTVGLSRTSTTSGFNTGTLHLKNDTNNLSGTITVNKNLTLNAQATDNTGSTLGTAAITLAAGRLTVKDNGTGSNGTLVYGNNITVAAAAGAGSNAGGALIDVNNSGANTGNTIQLGTLSIGAQTLTVQGGNSYVLDFAGQAMMTGNATFNATTAALRFTGGLSGSFGLTKDGAGNLELGGLSNYTGATVINAGAFAVGGAAGQITATSSITLNAGTDFVILNAPTNIADRVANTIPITMTNADLTYATPSGTGEDSNEVLGTVTLNGTMNVITVQPGTLAEVTALTITSLVRATPETTVNFVGLNLGAPGDSSRIILTGQADTTYLGPWATFGTRFLGYSNDIDGGVARGVILADVLDNPTEDQFTTGTNVRLLMTGTTTLLGDRSINTLSFGNFAAEGTRTLDLGANTLTLEGGGLSVNASANGGPAVINGAAASGGLTAGTTAAAADLFIINDYSLTIGARIVNNTAGGAVRLVKSGAGVLTLGGASTFTGGVVINEGVVSFADTANAGSASNLGANGAVRLSETNNVVTFRFTGAGADATDRPLNIAAPGAILDVTVAAGNLNWNGPVTSAGPLTKISGGRFTFGGTTNLTDLTVNGGSIGITGATTITGSLNVGSSGSTGSVIGTSGSLSVGSGGTSALNVGAEIVPTDSNTSGTVNLSGLTSFTANVSHVRVGVEGPNDTDTGINIGTLILAQSNNITASTSIVVGDSSGNGNNGVADIRKITFGPGANNITTPLLMIGGRKLQSTGDIAAGGTLTLNNGAGRTTLTVGENTADTSTQPVDSLNLTGGTFIASLGPVTVGRKTTGGAAGQVTATLNLGNSPSTDVNINVTTGNAVRAGIYEFTANNGQPTTGQANGTIVVGGGTIIINSTSTSSAVLLGNFVNSGTAITGGSNSATGTFTINGGSVTINSPSGVAINLGARSVIATGGTQTSTGTLNIAGGSLTVNNIISGNTAAGTQISNLNLTAGLLNMQSRNITNVTNITFSGGTLRDVGTLNGPLTQTGTASLLEVTAAHTGTATIGGNYALNGGAASVAGGETLSITGTLSIGAAGTMRGNGTVTPTAASNVAVAGTIAPGASIGNLTISGANVVFAASTGTMETELDNTSADLLTIASGGKIDLTAANDRLVIVPTPFGASVSGGPYTIASFPAGYVSGTIAGNQFDQVFVETLSGNVLANTTQPTEPNYVNVVYNADNIQVTVANLTGVPEPGTVGLAATALIGLLGMRRRRRRVTA